MLNELDGTALCLTYRTAIKLCDISETGCGIVATCFIGYPRKKEAKVK
jgi:hypothetical protein